MTIDDLFDRADQEYRILCQQVNFIDKPEFITFPLPTVRHDIDVTVDIRKGKIFEIRILHKNAQVEERIRP